MREAPPAGYMWREDVERKLEDIKRLALERLDAIEADLLADPELTDEQRAGVRRHTATTRAQIRAIDVLPPRKH